MPYDPQTHHRHSIRLQGYDFTQPGAYFITILTWHRVEIFGAVIDHQVHLTDFGQIARNEWFKTAQLRDNVKLHTDEFVVMPNHVHGIIWIVDDDAVGARRRRAPTTAATTTEQFGKPVPASIPTIVRAYKSAVTYQINQTRSLRGAPIWHRNYYENIIRDEAGLSKIRNYIASNPLHWQTDQLHPAAPPNRFNQGNP